MITSQVFLVQYPFSLVTMLYCQQFRYNAKVHYKYVVILVYVSIVILSVFLEQYLSLYILRKYPRLFDVILYQGSDQNAKPRPKKFGRYGPSGKSTTSKEIFYLIKPIKG